MNNLTRKVVDFLVKRDRAEKGYRLFVDNQLIDTGKPMETEEEVLGAIFIALREPDYKPVIRVEDPLGNTIMNLDTSIKNLQDVTLSSGDDSEPEEDEDDDDYVSYMR